MHVNVALAFWCLYRAHYRGSKRNLRTFQYQKKQKLCLDEWCPVCCFTRWDLSQEETRPFLLCAQMYKRSHTNTLKHLHACTYTQTLARHTQTNTQMHKSMTNTWMSHRNWPSSHPRDKRGDNALYIFSSLQLLIIVQSEPLPKNRSFLMRRSLLHNLVVFIQV